MKIAVEHVTIYRYAAPVRGVVQSHRLHPSTFDGQRVIDWRVEVTDGVRGGGFRDGAGDMVQAWTVGGPVSEITVRVQGVVETTDLTGVLRGHREVVAPGAYIRPTAPTRAGLGLTELSRVAAPEGDILALAHALSDAVAGAIAYVPGATDAKTTAEEALTLGEGVCQDHAQALIAIARLRGVPARFVSGYLLSGTGDQAAHAWAELHVPGLGWVGFDAANACCPDDRYVRLGSGVDARDAAPIKGTARGGGEESLDVEVRVTEAAAQTQTQQ